MIALITRRHVRFYRHRNEISCISTDLTMLPTGKVSLHIPDFLRVDMNRVFQLNTVQQIHQ